MPVTPIYALRYPAATDPADVPTDMQELATDVEAALTQLAYQEMTTTVTISAIEPAAPNVIVTAAAITTVAGQKIIVEVYLGMVLSGGAQSLRLTLFDGSTPAGHLAYLTMAAGAACGPFMTRTPLAPAAGSHTYSLRAALSGGAPATAYGGTGGSATMPAYVRVIRAA